jgi:hypothetical protein
MIKVVSDGTKSNTLVFDNDQQLKMVNLELVLEPNEAICIIDYFQEQLETIKASKDLLDVYIKNEKWEIIVKDGKTDALYYGKHLDNLGLLVYRIVSKDEFAVIALKMTY